jgi:hypothetical protein
MSDVRAIDSTAAAYQASLGANPPVHADPVPGEIFSVSSLWIVVIAAIAIAFWLGRRKRPAPATATASATATPASVTAAAVTPPPSRIGNWFTRWFTPSAAVLETVTKGESDDIIDKMLALTPSANLDRDSLKKSLPKFFAKLQELQTNGNFELRRYEPTAPDSANLEDVFARFTRKNTSLEVACQEVSQQREDAYRKLVSRDEEITELKGKVTAAKQEATASDGEAKQARTDLIAYRNSVKEIAENERRLIREGKRNDSHAVIEGFLLALDKQRQPKPAPVSGNRDRQRGSNPRPERKPEGEVGGGDPSKLESTGA